MIKSPMPTRNGTNIAESDINRKRLFYEALLRHHYVCTVGAYHSIELDSGKVRMSILELTTYAIYDWGYGYLLINIQPLLLLWLFCCYCY